MSIVHIKPAPDSKAFKANIVEQTFEKKEGSDEKRLVSEEFYKGERWDGTYQYDLPRFIYSKNRFTILDPLDPTKELTSESSQASKDALNKLVKECFLKYEKGHPLEGQLIEKANIHDDSDPFFTHNSVFIRKVAGEAFVDDENPINKIMLLVLPTFKDIAYGGNKMSGNLPMGVKTLIVDSTIDKQLYNEKRKNRAKAQEIINKLQTNDKVKVALALGLISNPDYTTDNQSIDDLEILLDEYVFDDKGNTIANKYSKQEYFIYVIEQGANLLNGTWLFHKGKKEGLIKNYQGFYQAFGVSLGKTYDDAITFIATSSAISDDIREKLVAAIRALNSTALAESTLIGSKQPEENE